MAVSAADLMLCYSLHMTFVSVLNADKQPLGAITDYLCSCQCFEHTAMIKAIFKLVITLLSPRSCYLGCSQKYRFSSKSASMKCQVNQIKNWSSMDMAIISTVPLCNDLTASLMLWA